MILSSRVFCEANSLVVFIDEDITGGDFEPAPTPFLSFYWLRLVFSSQ